MVQRYDLFAEAPHAMIREGPRPEMWCKSSDVTVLEKRLAAAEAFLREIKRHNFPADPTVSFTQSGRRMCELYDAWAVLAKPEAT